MDKTGGFNGFFGHEKLTRQHELVVVYNQLWGGDSCGERGRQGGINAFLFGSLYCSVHIQEKILFERFSFPT